MINKRSIFVEPWDRGEMGIRGNKKRNSKDSTQEKK
jgi:hypothetical protein